MQKFIAFSLASLALSESAPKQPVDNVDFSKDDVIRFVDHLPALGLNIHKQDVDVLQKAAENAHLDAADVANLEQALKRGVDSRNEGAIMDDLRSHDIDPTPRSVVGAVKALANNELSPNDLEYARERMQEAYLATKNPNISTHGFLSPHDAVAISFWIISIAMVATTVFLFSEVQYINPNWKTSINAGMLVTLIAAVHYFYMREYWITFEKSPIVYRYIDWSLTVPLQMVEFYLILKAVNPDISSGMFWRLLIGTVCMLLFGYLGENRVVSPLLGFVLGMAGWGFILAEIFFGEAGNIAAGGIPPNVQYAFQSCRFIVTVGWSIYPAGYFFGYLLGAVDDNALNLVYNLADFVNKIAFCLAIWSAAKQDTKISGSGLKESLV